MRLDLFLRLSRLCPRRTIAQKFCDAGLVLLNGRPAKSAHVVKADDLITLRRGEVRNQFRVVRVPGSRNVSKREAAELVEALPGSSFEPGSE